MPSQKLTDAFVRNLTFAKAVAEVHKAAKARGKPPPAPTQVTYLDSRDQRGLAVMLVVGVSSKTFRALTYRNGKPHSIKLGSYPQLGVAEAWEKAREHFRDPKVFAAKAETGTFKQVAQEWLKRHVVENKLRSQREIERCLAVYVYPRWGETKFLEIRKLEVVALLDWIVDRHGRAQADAVLAIVRGICNWYTARSEHYVSPIVAQMKRDRRPAKERARKRFLTDDEIRALWAAADAAGTFGALVKIALLTGQRREKLAHMQWSDLSDGVWTIASEEREKGTAGRITLPASALAIIDALPVLAGNPYVFAGRGSKAFNSFSQRKGELDALLPKEMPAWTLHDARRTCRKLMTRIGVRPDVAELALGHSLKGIQAVYDDVTEYAPLIDRALHGVADEIERILGPQGRARGA
jgi:integrase